MSRIVIRSSRLYAFFTFRLTIFIIPDRIKIEKNRVATLKYPFFFLPWVKDYRSGSINTIATVDHRKGLFWDDIRVEGRGGVSDLYIRGVSKPRARMFVEELNARAFPDAVARQGEEAEAR